MPAITSRGQPLSGRRHVYVFILRMLTLIFIVALVVVMILLATKWSNSKKLRYSVENPLVQNLNLTDDNHMSATFKFTIKLHNSNQRTSVYYNSVEIFVKLKDQTLAFDTIEPFHQPQMNVTQITDKLITPNVAVYKSNWKDLKAQASSGVIDLQVFVKARVWFKVGIWKSAHHTAEIVCPHVKASLSHTHNPQSSPCDADI